MSRGVLASRKGSALCTGEREKEEAKEAEGKRAELERLRLQMEYDRQVSGLVLMLVSPESAAVGATSSLWCPAPCTGSGQGEGR